MPCTTMKQQWGVCLGVVYSTAQLPITISISHSIWHGGGERSVCHTVQSSRISVQFWVKMLLCSGNYPKIASFNKTHLPHNLDFIMEVVRQGAIILLKEAVEVPLELIEFCID